jgi:hypothetical protein
MSTTADAPSIYDLLAAPAPSGAGAGETLVTLSKETLDADTEHVPDDDVIHGRGG